MGPYCPLACPGFVTMSEVTLWRYRRKFEIGGVKDLVRVRSSTSVLFSCLYLDGKPVSRDQTPPAGPNAARNHKLATTVADGSALEVEAGYIRALNVGIAVRRDGTLVHQSHLGGTIAYPETYREAAFANANADMTLSDAVQQGSAQECLSCSTLDVTASGQHELNSSVYSTLSSGECIWAEMESLLPPVCLPSATF